MPNFILVFDEVMLSQLKKLGQDKKLREMLTKMLDKIEELGPRAGELIDSKLFLYEVKSKHPPVRLYYRHNKLTNEICMFEYEMKTSSEKQKKTIAKIRNKT